MGCLLWYSNWSLTFANAPLHWEQHLTPTFAAMGQWAEPTPELDPIFPRMESVLCPQTWCGFQPTQVWKEEVPSAALKAQQSWGWVVRVPHPGGQRLSSWPRSPLGQVVKLRSFLSTPIGSTLKAYFWELSLWWGESFPLCEQIYWCFLQSQLKAVN